MPSSPPRSASDRPISGPAEDRLERVAFAGHLADALVDRRSRRSTGIVAGVTGPWGSGKSSVLNLVARRIRELYPEAIVVRFDPWLVSGRDTLVLQFMGEMLSAIPISRERGAHWHSIASSLARYSKALSPLAKIPAPLLGDALSSAGDFLAALTTRPSGLTELKSELDARLGRLSVPFVVLIDEVDRVEDSEVRTIAQLVRAIADFPRVSYLLAYDHDRVVQALGSVKRLNRAERKERGQSYLEKIVQIAIPLPVSLPEELMGLFLTEIETLATDGLIPNDFRASSRFTATCRTVIETAIETPRDIKRLIGYLRVLIPMSLGEIDWSDLIGYSALATKYPGSINEIRRNIDTYVDDPISEMESIRRATPRSEGTRSISESIDKDSIPLIELLFPAAGGTRAREDAVALPISRRRSLLTVLRFGLPPGDMARAEPDSVLESNADEVTSVLHDAMQRERLGQLLDRIDDLYADHAINRPLGFWSGAAEFVRPASQDPPATILTKRDAVENLGRTLVRASTKNPKIRPLGFEIISHLNKIDDVNILADIVRLHFFMYGIFGRRKDGATSALMSEDQTLSMGRSLSNKWYQMLLQDALLPNLSAMDALFVLDNTDALNDSTRAHMNNAIKINETLDRLVLLMYGGTYLTDTLTLSRLFDLSIFEIRVEERLGQLGIFEDRDSDLELNDIPTNVEAALLPLAQALRRAHFRRQLFSDRV
jgi:hypothetical protein